MSEIPKISVQECAVAFAAHSIAILDVREEWELAIVKVSGAYHIPLGQLVQRAGELAKDTVIAVLCHHGNRSARATAWLREQGFAHVVNIAGGIDAWALEVDPSLERY